MPEEYDDMQFEDDGAMSEMGDEEMPEEDGEEIDAEFAMHAAKLGFTTPEQQKAFKSAIDRCYALGEETEADDAMAETDMGAEDDLEGLAALA